MFRNIIKTTIEVLDKILQELKRAYDETYGLSDLNREFNERVNEIRQENKANFLRIAEKFEAMRGLMTFEFPSKETIKKRANDRWLEAMMHDDIDELFNVKERSNNE